MKLFVATSCLLLASLMIVAPAAAQSDLSAIVAEHGWLGLLETDNALDADSCTFYVYDASEADFRKLAGDRNIRIVVMQRPHLSLPLNSAGYSVPFWNFGQN